jgi:flagellar basal-body rod modification protein FlgD
MAISAPTPASGGNTFPGKSMKIQTQDFIRMMVTQLQNQDPFEPAKNEQLLAQMSQIAQLESSTQTTETLKSLTVQNQIGAAAGLIGKMVQGLDDDGDPVDGLVTSIRVEKDIVRLELDNGKTLKLSNVTSISSLA